MQVKLNAWRGEHGPGTVLDFADEEAAAMIHHGTAHAHDDLDAELDKAEAAKATGRIVKGAATLVQATGMADGQT